MNKKIYLSAMAGAVLLAACFLYVYLKNNGQKPDEKMLGANSQSDTHADSLSEQEKIRKEDEEDDKRREETAKRFAKLFNYNNEIKFYGRVMNQFGEPVDNASVKYMAIDARGEGNQIEVLTDSKGFFKIEGVKSLSLGIMIDKKGYHYFHETNRKSFFYSENILREPVHRPDPANPYVFTIKKMGATEPLIFIWKDQVVEDISKPVYYSLSTGKIVTENEADLKMQFEHRNIKPFQIDDRGREGSNFDWQVKIETIGNAGIIILPMKQEELYGASELLERYIECPDDGYITEINIKVPMHKSNNGEYSLNKNHRIIIYYKTNEKKYGIAILDFTASYGKEIYIRYESFLNPSGSRNIEYDPDKITKLYR